MKKRSKRNNPEQKTKNGTNPERYEMAGEQGDPVAELKKRNAQQSQPVESKQSGGK
ncbi:MAG TPA: hypothetical protein VEY51_02390 [Chondromyces sp.]|nr:hypothetical protein [Chondromyces sp.]